jgi:hypothetical protein
MISLDISARFIANDLQGECVKEPNVLSISFRGVAPTPRSGSQGPFTLARRVRLQSECASFQRHFAVICIGFERLTDLVMLIVVVTAQAVIRQALDNGS